MKTTILHIIIATTLILTLFGCGSVETKGIGITDIPQNHDETLPTEDRETPKRDVIDYKQKFINNSNCDRILDKEFLHICYDHNLKVAKSVAYTLYGDLVDELNIKKRPSFYIEEDIDKPYRAKVSDYSHSGYDRGHMAPDSAFDWSQESLDATYSLANIIPQIPEVNQQMWVEAEKYAREVALELFELHVVNVVKYSSKPHRIGKSNIAISVGYYKILFNHDKEYEECFYYANDSSINPKNDKLKDHKVSCSII